MIELETMLSMIGIGIGLPVFSRCVYWIRRHKCDEIDDIVGYSLALILIASGYVTVLSIVTIIMLPFMIMNAMTIIVATLGYLIGFGIVGKILERMHVA